uniref:Uncharacterized protein n=1 Tax=Arundo donax TaxID=35708 RepID=A0A0A9C0B7_ARUDO
MGYLVENLTQNLLRYFLQSPPFLSFFSSCPGYQNQASS